jgi:hypothetical protein
MSRGQVTEVNGFNSLRSRFSNSETRKAWPDEMAESEKYIV